MPASHFQPRPNMAYRSILSIPADRIVVSTDTSHTSSESLRHIESQSIGRFAKPISHHSWYKPSPASRVFSSFSLLKRLHANVQRHPIQWQRYFVTKYATCSRLMTSGWSARLLLFPTFPLPLPAGWARRQGETNLDNGGELAGGGVREMDSKSGKSWLFGLGRGPERTAGSLPLERMRKRRRAGHLGVSFLVAGQAKWKFRSTCDNNRKQELVRPTVLVRSNSMPDRFKS